MKIIKNKIKKQNNFLTNWYYCIKYNLKDLKYKISCFFSPRQKWLTKKIPRDYRDKDVLIEICILEGIKHYVEKEDCFNTLATEPSPDDVIDCSEQYKFLAEVKENYRLITEELPRLEKLHEEEWAKIPKVNIDNIQEELNSPKQSYQEKYGQIDKLEEEIYNLKTKIMVWAVEKRNQMWT